MGHIASIMGFGLIAIPALKREKDYLVINEGLMRF
jgi:hypothetical protein